MKKQLYWIFLAGFFLVTIGLLNGTAVSAQPPLAPEAPNGVSITAVAVETGFQMPVDIANAGDDRLFIVEQRGKIRIIDPNGNLMTNPFLDLSAKIAIGHPEQGLLGMAFHPNYPHTPYFYVNYTAGSDGATVIVRYTVSSDPDVANPNSAVEILRIDQPAGNHNAGDLNFGPQDGYLYIAMGDGGGQNDPSNLAQDMTQLLGKVLRLDVDSTSGLAPDCGTISGGTPPYTIPNDNPFSASGDGICNEIWASGLRNPWRVSFDRQTYDYYIADVGQNLWEEVNFQRANSTGGENYGWRCYEANHTTINFNASICNASYIQPFIEYSHGSFPYAIDEGLSITGGYVYRGNDYPALQGIYIYADYVSNNFWFAQNNGSWNVTPLGPIEDETKNEISDPSSFGEGCDGELYVASHTGTIYKIQDNSTPRPEGAVLDQFMYLPLVFGGNGSGYICSG
ncbi:MAG: PQQ-dependent sugar dehydrogenase [Anaerolineales bacterium]|nr:PQQ-dependent sugar dehydrogenase [Anaerolineales bacterium]